MSGVSRVDRLADVVIATEIHEAGHPPFHHGETRHGAILPGATTLPDELAREKEEERYAISVGIFVYFLLVFSRAESPKAEGGDDTVPPGGP
jgi:hypothetical protein